MLIKKKDSHSKAAWPPKPTALVSKTVASKRYNDNYENDWPPPYHNDNDDDSGCSFSSAPSSFSDYDQDENEDDLKDIGEKDTKLPPSTSRTTTRTEVSQLSPYFFHVMPTMIHDARTSPSSDDTPSNCHEVDHGNNNKDDKEITHSSSSSSNNNNNVSSELFQMGSLLVVGLVGFLVVFAVGVAVGEHHHRQDHDREDHSHCYYWDAPRQVTRHRRTFREW